MNFNSDHISTVLKWCYAVSFWGVNRFSAYIIFTGNYTETLSDANIATGLQPSFLKAFVRGESNGRCTSVCSFLCTTPIVSPRKDWSLKTVLLRVVSVFLISLDNKRGVLLALLNRSAVGCVVWLVMFLRTFWTVQGYTEGYVTQCLLIVHGWDVNH